MRRILRAARFFAAIALAVSITRAPAASAEHAWIQPSTFVAPYGGEPVTVRLFVGNDWRTQDERAVDPESIVRFRVTGSTGRSDLAPQVRSDTKPLTRVDYLREGLHVVTLDLAPEFRELPAEQFEDSLRDDHLGAILTKRAEFGESKHSGRELHRRSCKAILQVGERRDGGAATIVGSDLELLPAAIQEHHLSLDVRFQGRPIPDLLVEVLSQPGEDSAGVASVSARTDPRGRVELDIPSVGQQLVRARHLVRCEECDGVEWLSFGSTLLYASPAMPAAPRAAIHAYRAPDEDHRGALSLALALVVLGAAAYFVKVAPRA